MKIDRPKQLLAINNIPILIYTIRKFDACTLVASVIVAAPRESVDEVRDLVGVAGFHKPVLVVEGGARRQDSVAIALEKLPPDTTLVAVHDAVRPFVATEDIEAVIREADQHGAAILGIPIVDTVKKAERDFVETTVARERLVLAQTPQVFRLSLLRDAFDRARRDEYYGTDESSLVERMGKPVFIVRGSDRNIKITRPSDLKLARMFLEEEESRS
jgi:2-C-methyl-D-erythritol 4-phosphate cytidylyltransferase